MSTQAVWLKLFLIVAAIAVGFVIVANLTNSSEASSGSVARTSYEADLRQGYDDTIRVVWVPVGGREVPCVIAEYVGTVAMDCELER